MLTPQAALTSLRQRLRGSAEAFAKAEGLRSRCDYPSGVRVVKPPTDDNACLSNAENAGEQRYGPSRPRFARLPAVGRRATGLSSTSSRSLLPCVLRVEHTFMEAV
jgi:hypothetical protein